MKAQSFAASLTAGFGMCIALIAGAPACAQGPGADRWRITPGEGIGQVRLGMTRASLHTLLGAPQGPTTRQQGVLIERWAAKKPSAKSARLNFKTDFLTVYFRKDRVVQIDASSPAFKLANGLSTQNSAQEFQAHYRGQTFHSIDRRYLHGDPEGIPAGKHFVRYEDDVNEGLALRYGWWGNLAPDPNPSLPLETISVHPVGRGVLEDPDGADHFTITAAYVQKHSRKTP